jgi:hypothetical protein
MSKCVFAVLACLSFALVAGCPVQIHDIEIIADRLIDAVGTIQTQPQSLPPALTDAGDTIVIADDAIIVDDPAEDLVLVELPDQTVLGFENDTGFDIFITYYIDGELQSVYVYDGEALLLDYPCIGVIQLVSEDDIDPVTELLVDSFNLEGTDFMNPEDFICGEAFILNFDPSTISVRTEAVELLW